MAIYLNMAGQEFKAAQGLLYAKTTCTVTVVNQVDSEHDVSRSALSITTMQTI